MTHRPLITISIVSHGDKEKLRKLLASQKKHEPNIEQIQLIITDNLGNELPDLDPSPWASLHILRNNHPTGFAANHNQAFKLAHGKYFAILNPDLIFTQPIFEHLTTSMYSHQANLIAPQIVDENGIIQDSFRTLPSPLEIIRRRLPGYKFKALQPDSEGLIHPDWVAGMFLLMSSDTFRKLGGMDEKYRLYFEDVDFCTRARLKGMKIVVDTQVQIRHDAQRASQKKLYYLLLHSQSAIRFFTSPAYHQARQKF